LPVAGQVRNVAIGGGGYVTGICADPNEKGLFYIRTDVGGAYRWDAVNARWIPLLDRLSASDFGVESIAVDAGHARTVYLQTGKYLYDKAKILKSTDAGENWTPMNTPPKLASFGNGPQRMAGERLQVDPNQPDTLFLASRTIGLWKSTDGSNTWSQVNRAANEPFPKGEDKVGLNFVVFDKGSGKPGQATPVLYVGVVDKAGADGGVWKTADGGKSWVHLEGGLKSPARAAVAADGTCYVTFLGGKDFPGGVFKAPREANALTACAPDPKLGYCAISADPADPKTIYASQYASYNSKTFVTHNAGQNWTVAGAVHGVGNPATRDGSQWFGNISQLAANPFSAGEVWMADYLGVLRTPNISDPAKPWNFLVTGHEEIVPLILVGAPGGAPLLSGSADVNGHRSADLTVPPPGQFRDPSFGSTTGLDFCEADPNVWARVYKSFVGAPPGGYSTDDGVKWTPFKNVPHGVDGGRIAVSATNPKVFVWSTEKGKVFFTKDQGSTWEQATTAPAVSSWEFSQNAQVLTSDRVDGDTFYLLRPVGEKPVGRAEIWRSVDGGQTWAVAGTIPLKTHESVTQYKVIASHAAKGKLWVALAYEGVYRSADGGQTFTGVPEASTVGMIAFGKGRPGGREPAVFLYGGVGGAAGLFRSDDDGGSWKKIELQSPINDAPKIIGADRQTFGRVYIGTDGRGIYVVDSD
ncbi:MAG: hypothetical protein INR62_06575, partial [Rhodospirillales bacterium]|nr:hypothetical protein [Acetobacter sp.]